MPTSRLWERTRSLLGLDLPPTKTILRKGPAQITASWQKYMQMLDKAEVIVASGTWPTNYRPSATINEATFMGLNFDVHDQSDVMLKIVADVGGRYPLERNSEKKVLLRDLASTAHRLSLEYERLFWRIAGDWPGSELNNYKKEKAKQWLWQQRANVLTKAEVEGIFYSYYMTGHGLDYAIPCEVSDQPIEGPHLWEPTNPQVIEILEPLRESTSHQEGLRLEHCPPLYYNYGVQYGTRFGCSEGGFGADETVNRAGVEDIHENLDFKDVYDDSPLSSYPPSPAIFLPRHPSSNVASPQRDREVQRSVSHRFSKHEHQSGL